MQNENEDFHDYNKITGDLQPTQDSLMMLYYQNCFKRPEKKHYNEVGQAKELLGNDMFKKNAIPS